MGQVGAPNGHLAGFDDFLYRKNLLNQWLRHTGNRGHRMVDFCEIGRPLVETSGHFQGIEPRTRPTNGGFLGKAMVDYTGYVKA
jgi:hypothetical protein